MEHFVIQSSLLDLVPDIAYMKTISRVLCYFMNVHVYKSLSVISGVTLNSQWSQVQNLLLDGPAAPPYLGPECL